MVMKRYPNGALGEFFFMKRTPTPHPDWLRTCSIRHASGNVIDFPVIEDLASLLWVVNLGCIDLNPWYARCDDVDRPDYLHFDLDPVPGAHFERVRARRAARARGARRARNAELSEDDRLARHPRLRADPARSDAEAGLDVREGVRACSWRPAHPTASRPNTARPAGPEGGCSWTTTRTPGAARSPRSTPCARRPPRRSRRR